MHRTVTGSNGKGHARPHYEAMIRKKVHRLCKVHDDYRDQAMYELAARFHSDALKYIPLEHQNRGIINVLVQHHRYALESVPAKYRDAELYELAVRSFPEHLHNVPGTLITERLLIIAIHSGFDVSDLPKGMRTYNVCIAAAQRPRNPVHSSALSSVPPEHKDRKMYETFVATYGYSIRDVPEDMIDARMCKLAVQQNGFVLDQIQARFLTLDIYETAVKKNGLVLKIIPAALRTHEICWLAAQQNPDSMEYILDDIQFVLWLAKRSLAEKVASCVATQSG